MAGARFIKDVQSPDFLLNKKHLTLRTIRIIEIAKIRSTILKFVRSWFIEKDWIEITPPTIVKAFTNSDTPHFKIHYFGEDVLHTHCDTSSMNLKISKPLVL